jgi:8-oxo-dGTP diphosphatase
MSAEPWDDYAYTALIVFCFLIRDGKILLIRRANEPYKGQVTVPGGRKKRGETLKQACAREMLEETGYVLKDMQFAGILHAYREGDKMEYLSNYFVCRSFEGTLKA